MEIEQIARLGCKNALADTQWGDGLVLQCEMLSYLIRNMRPMKVARSMESSLAGKSLS